MTKNLFGDMMAMLEEERTPVKKLAPLAGVSPRWLYRIKAGEVADPSVHTTQLMYNYLLAKKKRTRRKQKKDV